jgi:calcineurin-like phosphoesterase family protein
MDWVTADDHFAHNNILKFTTRPFKTIEEHDEYLIKRWNETVDRKDRVFILGDFAWRNHKHYVGALNGQKILIIGSHDKMSQIDKAQFTEIHKGMLVITLNKIPFVMTHCAMKVWERSHYGAINLYGHSHGRLEEFDNKLQMDVGVDVSPDYAPFSLDFIIYKMSLKIKQVYNTDVDINKNVMINRNNNLKLMEDFNKKVTQ